jgi:hypothetical protein
VRDLARHAPEEEPLDAGQSSAADDDQVCLLLVRYLDDDFGRVAFARIGLQLDAFGHAVFGALENRDRDSA